MDRDAKNAKQGLQRDDWMMMPPTQDGLLARMDPTKLRPGKFRSGKAAGGPAGGGIESTWTETPEQKRIRLENEMLGIAAPANSSVNTAQSVRKEDEDAARRIKEYNVSRAIAMITAQVLTIATGKAPWQIIVR